MDSRKFEDSYKEAFEGAEISPSENLWTNIELDLEKADGEKVRRRLFFYKMLAAASVTFALAIAGAGYYWLGDRSHMDIASNKITGKSGTQDKEQITANTETPLAPEVFAPSPGAAGHNEKQSDGKKEVLPSIDAPVNNDDAHRESDRTQTVPGAKVIDENKVGGNSEIANNSKINNVAGDEREVHGLPGAEVLVSDPDRSTTSTAEVADFSKSPLPAGVGPFTPSERTLPAFYPPKKPELILTKPQADAGALLLAKLAREEAEFAAADKKEHQSRSERLWTSVGFAAGGFSAVNSGATTPASNSFIAQSNSAVPDKQAKASGVAYSFGINLGAKLSKRWILQGGVNYLTQSSDYVATNVVADNNYASLKAESINELDKLSAARLAPTFPYSVNNVVQFFSLPVQAGYLVVNKKFGLQLNAGVSTDLFLQNTITPEGGSLDKTTQGSGADSPYRSVNFSGLMGTELSYRFGQRYRVALNPGLRYPLNSVYKTDVGVQSTPITFDVGLRFRYIFH